MDKWVLSFLGLMIFMVLFSSCEKNLTVLENNDSLQPSISGAFIVNEGNFQQGNASLSFFTRQDGVGKIFNHIFKLVNNADLGDVANSMIIQDSLGYIVVNNSDKIEVINVNNFKRVQSIQLPSGSSPRNMVILGDDRAYVTNLFNNSVSIIDLESGAVTGSIPVGPNPEGIYLSGGYAFVANSGFGFGNTVSVISIDQDSVVATPHVGDNPQWIEADAEGEIHVLCAGSYGTDFSSPDDDTPGGVWVVHPVTRAVVDSLVMEKGEHPMELTLSKHHRGYFLYEGAVVEYDTQSNTITQNALITGFFYHVRVSDETQELFVLDAKDFVSPGELKIYDLSGQLKDSFTVGVIPGFVAFLPGSSS